MVKVFFPEFKSNLLLLFGRVIKRLYKMIELEKKDPVEWNEQAKQEQ